MIRKRSASLEIRRTKFSRGTKSELAILKSHTQLDHYKFTDEAHYFQ